MINNNCNLIYQSKGGYKIYAVKTYEEGSCRIAIEVFTESPKGEKSDIQTVRKSDLFKKKNAVDFILDLDGDFDELSLLTISENLKTFVCSETKKVTIAEKASPQMLIESLSELLVKEAKAQETSEKPTVIVKDGYASVESKAFKDLVIEHSDTWHYTKLDILKRLKIFGYLETSPNRAYDKYETMGAHGQIHFYKIKLKSNVETK